MESEPPGVPSWLLAAPKPFENMQQELSAAPKIPNTNASSCSHVKSPGPVASNLSLCETSAFHFCFFFNSQWVFWQR